MAQPQHGFILRVGWGDFDYARYEFLRTLAGAVRARALGSGYPFDFRIYAATKRGGRGRLLAHGQATGTGIVSITPEAREERWMADRLREGGIGRGA